MIRGLTVNWLFLALTSLALAGETAPALTKKPTASRAGNKVRIEFAVDRETDVAVFIEDTNGKVVRHLASGVLGPNAPGPLTLIYDCAANEWLSLQDFADKDKNGRLIVPDGYGVSTGMMWEPRRKLIWAGDTIGGMSAMRFDRKSASPVPLDRLPSASQPGN